MMKSKFVRLLFSVILAFTLWLYIITVQVPEETRTYNDISVVFQNDTVLREERNLIVVTENVPTINLTLKGSRSDLNKLSKDNITAVVNLSQVYEAGQHRLNYNLYYPPEVSGNAFEVVGSTPSTISLNVEKYVEKNVPVVVACSGSVPEGYIADTLKPELSEDTVRISGPGSVIDQITKAVINVDLTNRTQTIVEVAPFTLCNDQNEAVDAKRVTTSVGEIELKLRIQAIREVKLTLTVIDGGGATLQTSNITIEPATITVSGGKNVLDELETINLGTINLADYMEDTELTFPIILSDNVTNRSGYEEAKVSVRFPELAKKTLTITNIQKLNVPAGMEVEMATQALTVTVRGPKAQVQDMKETDLIASIDLNNLPAGGSTLPVEIKMGDAFRSVGIVGSYSASVTLREKTETP